MAKSGAQRQAVASSSGAQEGTPAARAGQPLRIERRAGARWATGGTGMATFVGQEGTSKLVRVRLVDACHRGLGVTCDEPIEVGSVFTLYPDDVVASASHGRVVRCAGEGSQYRLGLQRLIRHAA